MSPINGLVEGSLDSTLNSQPTPGQLLVSAHFAPTSGATSASLTGTLSSLNSLASTTGWTVGPFTVPTSGSYDVFFGADCAVTSSVGGSGVYVALFKHGTTTQLGYLLPFVQTNNGVYMEPWASVVWRVTGETPGISRTLDIAAAVNGGGSASIIAHADNTLSDAPAGPSLMRVYAA